MPGRLLGYYLSMSVAAALLFFPLSIVAGERESLFPENNPRKIFQHNLSESDEDGIVLLRDWSDRKKAEELKKAALKKEEVKSATRPKPPESREEIIELLGDPTEDTPIQAVESAPGPFKGIMWSLNAGDEELAWKYARQYSRYMRKLEDFNERAVGLQAKALEIEGLVDGEGWTNDVKFQEYNKYLDADLKQEKAQVAQRQVGYLTYLRPEVQAIVTSREGFEQGGQDLLFREEVERAKIYQALRGIVPVDPSGKVEVYLFFRPNDKDSILLGRELEKLHQISLQDEKFTFAAFTLEKTGGPGVQAFRQKTGATYSVVTGAAPLASTFKIETVPSVVVYAPSTQAIVLEEGLRRAYYFDEIRKLIQGKATEVRQGALKQGVSQ